MNWERFLVYCFCASPALLIGLLIWMWVHIGIAIIFMAVSLFGSGYAARLIDEAIKKEEQTQNIMRGWRGPI